MAENEKVKEEIGWLKVVFALLVATDISIIAWLSQNYNSTNIALTILGAVIILFTTMAIVWVNKIAYRKINRLEKL